MDGVSSVGRRHGGRCVHPTTRSRVFVLAPAEQRQWIKGDAPYRGGMSGCSSTHAYREARFVTSRPAGGTVRESRDSARRAPVDSPTITPVRVIVILL